METVAYLGDVLAVAFSPDGSSAFAGAGSSVSWYDTDSGERLCCACALPAARVHHLHASDSLDGLHVVACGGRCAAVLHASRGAGIAPSLRLTWSLVPAAHFILTAMPTAHPGLLLGLSDNSVELWSSTTGQRVWRCVSDVRCLLCCMALHITPCGGARVVCGTAFSKAVVWHAAPDGASGGIICRGGHRGAIHSVRWAPDSNSSFVTASDDRTAVLWRAHGATYQPAAEMVGHAGRVWDVSIISPADAAGGVCLATASEDNTLRLWRAEPTTASTRAAAAQELSVLRGHTGRGIWCLAASPRGGLVTTGGADSCVMLWPTLTVQSTDGGEHASQVAVDAIVVNEPGCGAQGEEEHSIGASSAELFTRCLSFMDSRTLVAGTSRGAVHVLLLDGARAEQPWCRDIYCTQDGAAVTCLRRGHGPHQLVVGDFSGDVALLRLLVQPAHGGMRAELLCRWPAHAPHKVGAVFAFGGTTAALVGTADSVGTLRVWDVRCPIEPAIPLLLGEVAMTQRVVCATDAAIPGGLLLVVGTQGGKVEAFCITLGDTRLPVSSLGAVAHAHGANAVTALSECQRCSEDGGADLEFMSGGADGHVCSYLVSEQRHLRRVSRLRVSAVSAPEAVVGRPSEGARLLAGITSSDLVVYDHRTGVHAMRVTCGGWRRPHAVLLGDDGHCALAFSRSGKVHVHQRRVELRTGTAAAQPSDSPAAAVMTLSHGHHGRESRACVWAVPACQPNDPASAGVAALLTGSEDGIIRAAYIDAGTACPDAVRSTVAVGQTLGRAAVRAMCVVPHPGGHGSILVAAGARLVLMAWHLTWHDGNTRLRWQLLAQRALPSTPHSIRGGAAAAEEADTRYLCLTAWATDAEHVHVACGSSDAQLCVWSLPCPAPHQHSAWHLVATAQCAQLQLSAAHMHASGADMLIASGGSDGTVTVWACPCQPPPQQGPAAMRVLMALRHVHQSGVNALRAGDWCVAGEALVVSGGDDGALCALAITHTPATGQLRITGADRRAGAHASSIKAVALHATGAAVTVSMDQRVRCWHIAPTSPDAMPRLPAPDEPWLRLPAEQQAPDAGAGDMRGFWRAGGFSLLLSQRAGRITEACDVESVACCPGGAGALMVAVAGSGTHVMRCDDVSLPWRLQRLAASGAPMESEPSLGAGLFTVAPELGPVDCQAEPCAGPSTEALFEPYGGVDGYQAALRAAIAQELARQTAPLPLLNGRGHRRVNVLQRHRILVRRAARARAEAAHPAPPAGAKPKPYRFEGRHRTAVKRQRTAGGRFGPGPVAQKEPPPGSDAPGPTDAGAPEPAVGLHPAFCAA